MSLIRRASRLTAIALASALVFGSGADGIGAEEGWVDYREAGVFRCWADFKLDEMDHLLGHLNQLQADLTRMLGIRPANQPIELYLLRDYWSYRKFLKRNLPDIPYRRALYVKSQGQGRVYAYRSRQLEVDVRHECTHALLHAALPVVPLWLDEGLAEYFEVAPEKRAFDNPHLSSLRWNLRFGIVPKIEKLEKAGNISEMGGAEYRDAWAWTHFMIHGPVEARHELARFLLDIQGNTPPGLLSERLARRIPNPRAGLSSHFKSWRR